MGRFWTTLIFSEPYCPSSSALHGKQILSLEGFVLPTKTLMVFIFEHGEGFKTKLKGLRENCWLDVLVWLSVLCKFRLACLPLSLGPSWDRPVYAKRSPKALLFSSGTYWADCVSNKVSMNLLEVLVVAVSLSHVEGNPECDQAQEESTACQAK